MSAPSLKVVVAVTSSIAFEILNKNSILYASFAVARAFTMETGIKTHLALAVDDVSKVRDFSCEILECDPNNSVKLAEAIAHSTPCDLVAIHDSQRPLTRTTQFHRAIEALIGDVHAVRPASAFTETLKALTQDAVIARTIDRSSMLRISTPEVIRFNAIDFLGAASTWFVPLRADATTSTVDADPESLRINSLADIALMEAFIHWQ